MAIRVLVVDDSSFMRLIISRAVESAEGLKLVGTAANGEDALRQVAATDPDVVTLDIEMPRKTGLEALRELGVKRSRRPAVVMCSSLTVEGSDATLEALRLGASDFIAKDTSFSVHDGATFASELIAKIRAVAPRAITAKRRAAQEPVSAMPSALRRPVSSGVGSDLPRPNRVPPPSGTRVVVVGSSTGGPPVLEKLIRSLPADFRVPVVIAQHMPELFTRSLAGRLDQMTPLTVRLAEDGQALAAGTVTLGRGGWHVAVGRRAGTERVIVRGEPAKALYKPDVDELFVSAAETFGAGCVAVVLTGMGDDGADGAGRVRAAGGVVLAQDEDSCVVYGMPRAAVERGHAQAVGSPSELFAFVRALGGGSRDSGGSPLRQAG